MTRAIGVIPSAGYATRLQPLSGSKELIEIGGRSLIDYLIERMNVAACDEIRLVTRPEKADLVRHAERAGIRVVSGHPASVAESLLLGLRGLSPRDTVLYGFPDTIWQPVDGLAAVRAVVDGGEPIALGLFRTPDPARCDVAHLDRTGRVTRIEVKPVAPGSDWVYACCAARVAVLGGLVSFDEPGRYLDRLARARPLVAVRLGGMIDVGTPEAVLAANRDPSVWAASDRRSDGSSGGVDEVTVGGRTLAIVRGDITRVAANAIVNAANSALAGGGGVDGAIHRAGGPAIMAELGSRYGPDRHCPTGSAVVTGAGDLPARWVIHAVGPIWRGGGAGEPELLASAYRTSLRLAADLRARTVTFPAISCGVYGYPLDAAAKVALATVRDVIAAGGTSVERVTFVLFSAETLEMFRAALRALSTR